MPTIQDNPPHDVKSDLSSLSNALIAAIPSKTEGVNLLIGTWNLRMFSSANTQMDCNIQ